MDISQRIDFAQTQSIRQLAPRHPVYLVTLPAGMCVIKQDLMNDRSQASNIAGLMSYVSPGAKSRVLGTSELVALGRWINANAANIEVHGDQAELNYFLQIVREASRPPPPPGAPMTAANARRGIWTVMEAKANLMNVEDAAGQRVAGNKASVKAITEKLRAPGGLEKVGQIIAVDAFNNYGDRVNWDFLKNPAARSGKKVDGMPEKCRCLWNPGNFFVDGHEGVLGLDPIDPGSTFNDWRTMPDIPTGGFYSGTLLHKSKGDLRRKVAEGVIEDFELLLGPRNRRGVYKIVGATHRMPKDGVSRMVRGMEIGSGLVLAYFQQTFANGNIPLGLQRRFQACGWLTPHHFPRL